MTDQKAPNRKPARPRTEFNQKIADRICDKIIEGKSLRRICSEKWAPQKRTVLRWLEDNPTFAAQYARAREEQAESYADELMELGKQANSENAHAIRVRADIIKWVCSKLKPRKYADRVGVDMQADVTVREKVEPMELARHMVFLLHRAAIDSPLPQFIDAQVGLLMHVADQIRTRGHGSTKEGFYEGDFANLTQAIERLAEVVRQQLSGEAKPVKALPAPPSAPTTRARDDDGDVIDGNAVIL